MSCDDELHSTVFTKLLTVDWFLLTFIDTVGVKLNARDTEMKRATGTEM